MLARTGVRAPGVGRTEIPDAGSFDDDLRAGARRWPASSCGPREQAALPNNKKNALLCDPIGKCGGSQDMNANHPNAAQTQVFVFKYRTGEQAGYLIARQDASFGLTPLSTSATSFTQVPPKEAAPSGNGYSFLLAGKQRFIGALELAPMTLQAQVIQMDWAIVTIGGRQYLQPTDNDQVVVGIHLHEGAPDVSRLYLVAKPGGEIKDGGHKGEVAPLEVALNP